MCLTLESQPANDQRLQTIRSWVQAMARVRFGGPGGGRGGFGPLMSPEELDRFFKQLPQKEQDRLAALPHEEIPRELRRLYYQQFKGPKDKGPGHRDEHRGEHRDDRHPALESPKPSQPPEAKPG